MAAGGHGLAPLAAQVVVGLVVAFIAGLFGAWYQMRRHRARPFLVPESFTMELFDTQAAVQLPPDVVKQLSASVCLHDYGMAVARLEAVAQCAGFAAEIREQGGLAADGSARVRGRRPPGR